MPVFISHRTADDQVALKVYSRLTITHGIVCYLDDIDRRLKNVSDQELTRILVDSINKCTNLLAVITSNTAGSWWVPFEIGVAKQAPRVICSYTNQSDYLLPGYLKEWPRLSNERAIDEFAKLYKQQQKLLTENVLEKRASATNQILTVDSFHKSLKNTLGQ